MNGASDVSGSAYETADISASSEPSGSAGQIIVDTPTDRFRRDAARNILIGAGTLFFLMIGGSIAVLVLAALNPDEKNTSTIAGAQAVLTASIGFVGGAVSTVIGFYFQQPRD